MQKRTTRSPKTVPVTETVFASPEKKRTIALPSNFNITNLLMIILIIASFFIGSLYTKVQYLEKNGGSAPLPTTAAAAGGVTAAPSGPPTPVDVSVGHFPVKGDQNAKVTIIEFADFRCPYCEQLFSTVIPQIQKDYVDTGKAKFAFRSYAFLGPASTVAANAAECANDQGHFWDMHDYFYKNQPSESDTSLYTVDKLTEIAGTLGMDSGAFHDCLSANKFDKNVSTDVADGQKAGVSATPTVFINGVPIVGAETYTVFQQAIDAALKKS